MSILNEMLNVPANRTLVSTVFSPACAKTGTFVRMNGMVYFFALDGVYMVGPMTRWQRFCEGVANLFRGK